MKVVAITTVSLLVCLNAPAALAGHVGDYQAASQQDQFAARRLYSSGNECGPDQAKPVWGANNALVGYACEPASANGN